MNNGQIARGVFEELFSKGRFEYVDENYDRNFRGHDTLTGQTNREELRSSVQMYRAAFPDLTIKVDELVEAAEKVLVRWTARGTHRGPFLGKPATNKQSEVSGITVMTFKNGKLAEDFTQWDVLGLLRDLGLAPELADLGAQPSA